MKNLTKGEMIISTQPMTYGELGIYEGTPDRYNPTIHKIQLNGNEHCQYMNEHEFVSVREKYNEMHTNYK